MHYSSIVCIIFTLPKYPIMKIKPVFIHLIVFFTLLCSFQVSSGIFKRGYINIPNPYLKISMVSGKNYKFILKVTGENQHSHKIVYSKYGTFSSMMARTTIPDQFVLKPTEDKYAQNQAQITQATGLVKVAMAIFQEGIKMAEYFEVTPASSSEYRFAEIQSTTTCKFYLDPDYLSYDGWSLYRSSDSDPFSANLPALQKSKQYDLTAGEIVYLRVPNSVDFYLVHTLADNKCQSKCPYNQSAENYMGGVFSGTTDRCQCFDQKVYDWDKKVCIQCWKDSSPNACTLFEPPSSANCGNGVKETGEECDNRKQAGCTDCKVATGYTCSEDANKLSTCSQSTPQPDCGNGVKETGEECDNRKQAGCTDCKVATGYTCSEDANKLSTCSQSTPQPDCGNGVKETGEECDNRKQAGCTDCKVAAGYTCSEDANKLSVCSNSLEVPFLKLNHKIGPMTTYFYANAGQKLLVKGSSSSVQTTLRLNLYDPDSSEFTTYSNGQLLEAVTLTKTGTYKATLTDIEPPAFVRAKIQFYLDGTLFKEYYQIMPFQFSSKYKILFQFSSTKECKLKAYFTGTGLSSVTQFKIVEVGSLLFDANNPYTYVDYSNTKFTPSQLPFTFNINMSGKWYIEVYLSGDGSKDLNLELKTFSDSMCQDQCTQYLSKPNVIGRAPGAPNICLCDDSSTPLIWDSTKLSCEAPVFPTGCGNGVKETGEECDNRKQAGCTDCKVATGYTCSEDANKLSTCSQSTPQPDCGNGVKETGEECDNRKQAGCTDCKVATGYTCSEDANKLSTCSQSTPQPDCGNGVKETGEECDNRKQAGCTDCKVATGYTCSEDANKLSTCSQSTPQPDCGNGVKETGEECDNRKQAGCTDCKIVPGYSCSEDQAKLSTCVQNRCGDSKKGGNQECDNGNITGCIDCKVSSGYECSGGLGQKSTCTGKCGDGIKLASEECDNGGSAGCTGCKIDPGYNCVHNLYSKSLCLPICGDGIRAVTEECDNKNQTGCINCKPVPGFKCSGAVGAISDCKITCGDSVFGGSQQCDNGNQAGCSANCVPDKGYVCKNEVGARSVCSTVCGDGIKAGSEVCDNSKKIGCLTCNQEDDGFDCTGAVGERSNCKPICGDSKRQASEQCDNGNAAGCSKNCLPDIGYTCTGSIGAKSTCQTQCGDSIKAGTEACDNGKKKGCSNCIIQSGYSCKMAANMRTSICTKA